jgi:hypothetical protein
MFMSPSTTLLHVGMCWLCTWDIARHFSMEMANGATVDCLCEMPYRLGEEESGDLDGGEGGG